MKDCMLDEACGEPPIDREGVGRMEACNENPMGEVGTQGWEVEGVSVEPSREDATEGTPSFDHAMEKTPTVGEVFEEPSNAEEAKEKAPVRLQSRRKSLIHRLSSMVA